MALIVRPTPCVLHSRPECTAFFSDATAVVRHLESKRVMRGLAAQVLVVAE